VRWPLKRRVWHGGAERETPGIGAWDGEAVKGKEEKEE
jgi:hypothetical protein